MGQGRPLVCPVSSFPQLVMRYWETTPRGPVLWEARAEPWATWVPLLCFVLHVVSWLLIFSILLVFDYAELMGLKQVRLLHPYLRPVSARLSLPPVLFSWRCSPSWSSSLPSKASYCRSPGLEGEAGKRTETTLRGLDFDFHDVLSSRFITMFWDWASLCL